MVVTLDIDSVEGVVVGTVRGPLSLEQIREGAAAVWSDVKGPRVRVLSDLREAQFNFSAGEIRELAEFAKQHSPFTDLRMAFVVAGALDFGLVRMFEAYRETGRAQTAVFREEEQALAWLASGPQVMAP